MFLGTTDAKARCRVNLGGGLWMCSTDLPGDSALKNGGDSWWIFSALRLPRKQKRYERRRKFRERAEYCFESTVSEERTHWVLQQTRWVLPKTRWVHFGTQIVGCGKTAQEKNWIPGNGGSQQLFGPMFPSFCLFSLSFQWEEGQKVPRNFVPGNFFFFLF